MDVLRVVEGLEGILTVPQIALLLDITPSVVEAVVFGPVRWFFTMDFLGSVRFSTSEINSFLLNASRATDFFIHPPTPQEIGHYLQLNP